MYCLTARAWLDAEMAPVMMPLLGLRTGGKWDRAI